MVILDTNIIIDHLRQKKPLSILENITQQYQSENLALSVVSIQELYESRSTKNKNKEAYLLATIGPLTILPYDYQTAKLAGQLARDLKQPIELADAAIAATCLLNQASLATLNQKHFKKIAQLELLPLTNP